MDKRDNVVPDYTRIIFLAFRYLDAREENEGGRRRRYTYAL